MLDVCLYTSCVVFLKLPYGSLDARFKTFFQIEESLKNAELFSKRWIFWLTDEDQFLPTCSIFYSSNTIKTPLACIAAKVVRRHIFFCSSGFTLTRRDWFLLRGTLILRDILQNHNKLLFLLLFFFVAPLACFFKNKRCLLTWYKLFSLKYFTRTRVIWIRKGFQKNQSWNFVKF